MTQIYFNKQESEIIYLKAAIDLLDSMLTVKLFELRGKDPDSQIYFHEEIHQKYFFIILIDFLSKSNKIFNGEELTCLELIKKISETPNFDINKSISELKFAINFFNSWLNKEIIVKTWLPNINKECDLKLKRIEFIDACANISKHNFMRLTGVSNRVIKILKRNNIDITFNESLLILDDFYERFHNDILNYHGSNIVEMINNIRWGIQEYLILQFDKSYKKDNSESKFSYRYDYPKEINDKFAKDCFWSLMNSIRMKPYIKKFKSTEMSKIRY